MAYAGTRSFDSGGTSALTNGHVTRREVVLDDIAYKQAIEAPLVSTLERWSINSVTPEWLMGKIESDFDAATITGDKEGAEHTPSDIRYRVRAQNYTQIKSKNVSVSRTQRRMNEIGTGDEYAIELWESTKALTQEFEKCLLFGEAKKGASGTAQIMEGMFSWALETSAAGTVTIADRDIPDPYKSTMKAGSSVDMTLDEFNEDVLQAGWEKGMDYSQAMMLCGGGMKRIISKYGMVYSGSGATMTATPLNERSVPAMAHRLSDRIDIYDSDFGPIYIHKNRYFNDKTNSYTINSIAIKPGTAFIIFEPRYVKLCVLDGFKHYPLGKNGDNTRGFVNAELSLCVKNPRALVGGYNLVA